MNTDTENRLLKDALQQFFDTYHFADGGYNLKWFTIKVGFLNIRLPNIPSRVAVARIHDIHHVLTGYKATLRGEAEIAGWEIASSCGHHAVAWFFNLGAFFYGMFCFPRALFEAFMLGRKVTTNFYLTPFHYENLLSQSVASVKNSIQQPQNRPNTLTDYVWFASWCLLLLLPLAVLGYIVIGAL